MSANPKKKKEKTLSSCSSVFVGRQTEDEKRSSVFVGRQTEDEKRSSVLLEDKLKTKNKKKKKKKEKTALQS